MRALISIIFLTFLSTVSFGEDALPKSFSFDSFTITPKVTKKHLKNCDVEQVLPVLSGGKNLALQKNINERFEQWAWIYMQEHSLESFCKNDNDPDDSSWVFNSSYTILQQTDKYLSINFSQHTYTGGAHGDDSDECHLLNVQNGEEIDLAKFLDPAKSQEFLSAVQQSLHAVLDTGVDINDLKKALQKPMLCLDANGVYVQFRQYEIAPGSSGNLQANIDRKTMSGLLIANEVTAKLFNLADERVKSQNLTNPR